MADQQGEITTGNLAQLPHDLRHPASIPLGKRCRQAVQPRTPAHKRASGALVSGLFAPHATHRAKPP